MVYLKNFQLMSLRDEETFRCRKRQTQSFHQGTPTYPQIRHILVE